MKGTVADVLDWADMGRWVQIARTKNTAVAGVLRRWLNMAFMRVVDVRVFVDP